MLSFIIYLVVYTSVHLTITKGNSIVWENDEEGLDSLLFVSHDNNTNDKELELPGLVTFSLHSRSYHGIELNDSADKTSNNLHHLGRYPVAPLKIIIHGWMTNGTSEWVKAMTSAYLKRPRINVIVVNWGELSSDVRYYPALDKAVPVGKRVNKLIEAIVSHGYARSSDIHIIGHSLGAHVAGVIGHSFSGTIGRITGLEPSKPGYELADDAEMLTKDDAEMVDIIHTTAGTLGQFQPQGLVDFYPNGGANQPGCDGYSPEVTSYLESVSCSHFRVCEYFTESITNYKAFSSTKCPDDVSIPPKKEDCIDHTIVYMGENCPKTARGIYYLDTNDRTPYSKSR